MPEQEPPRRLESEPPLDAADRSPSPPASEQRRMDALSDALARMVGRQAQVEARLERIERILTIHAPQPPAAPQPMPAVVPLNPPPPHGPGNVAQTPPPLPGYV